MSCSKVGDRSSIEYELRVVERSSGEPGDNATCCAVFTAEYPEIVRAPTDEAEDSINAAVFQYLLSSHQNDSTISSIEQLADRFLENFKEFKQKNSDAAVSEWEEQRDISVLLNDYGLLVLEFYWQAYTGGAHPNSTTQFANFDIMTGRRLGLSDLLIDGYEEPLARIVESHFREARGLDPAVSLEEVGFWFEGGKFKLSDDFAIRDNGLTFYYNAYDIAAYAMGPTEVIVPYEELSDLIKKDGFLSVFLD
jgi:hypothetical protein